MLGGAVTISPRGCAVGEREVRVTEEESALCGGVIERAESKGRARKRSAKEQVSGVGLGRSRPNMRCALAQAKRGGVNEEKVILRNSSEYTMQ